MIEILWCSAAAVAFLAFVVVLGRFIMRMPPHDLN